MSWSRRLASTLLLCPFFAPSVLAAKGDYILGGGVSVDADDGIAAIIVADFGIGDQTWLSTSLGRSSVDLPRSCVIGESGSAIETMWKSPMVSSPST